LRIRLCRVFLVLFGLATIWAVALALTGGFAIDLDGFRISSRRPRNVIVIAGLSAGAAWALATPGRRRHVFLAELEQIPVVRAISGRLRLARRPGSRVAPYVAALASAARAAALASAAIFALVGAAALIDQWSWARPLWLDEEMIALNVRDRTLAELAGPLWFNQTAPLGWLGLERALIVQFGGTERVLRAAPVLFGVATLAVALWAGRRWMGPLGAAVFVLLCAFGQLISFFPLESKPYSADVFLALLLSALAVWAMEPANDEPAPHTRRAAIWWLIAAVGQWFGNGALFVTPGCAVVLCILAWRRAGWRHAFLVALPGGLWLASFGLHYQLSIRHTLHSEYLRAYWWWGLPPAAGGPPGTLRWLALQLRPLAANPGGTPLWITFWLTAACGIALAVRSNRPLGLVLAAAPASAFLLAAVRLVPLAERLSLWIVPALYMGIGVAVDASIRFGQSALANRAWSRLAAAVLGTVIVFRLGADIVLRGEHDLTAKPRSNHSLDDRSALRFLLARSQPGDVLATMRMGLPAVWWFGGLSVAGPTKGSMNPRDDSPVLEITHHWPGPECRSMDLKSVLAGRSRVALYLGFDSRNPQGLQELVLDTVSQLGTLTTYRRIAEEGLVAIFDLRLPPAPWTVVVTGVSGESFPGVPRPSGCAVFQTASRW
jgi:hypothetical protein